MKFKVGDEVRVLNDCPDLCYEVGGLGEIMDINPCILVMFENDEDRYVEEADLELVPAIKPENRLQEIKEQIAVLTKEKSKLEEETATSFVDKDIATFKADVYGDFLEIDARDDEGDHITLVIYKEDRDNLVRIIDNAITKSEKVKFDADDIPF